MSMIAQPWTDPVGWEYIMGDINLGLSIIQDRYEHLSKLDRLSSGSLQIAMRDVVSGAWTKWVKFPGPLVEFTTNEYRQTSYQVQPAYDIHRSTLENEVVVESDYQCEDCLRRKKEKLLAVNACPDCYEKNYEATRIIGRILESKGFKPLYYYSGNKSLHVHVYFDFGCFKELDMFLQKQLMEKFKYRSRLVKKFIEWLRERIISCWDLEIREFDTDLIKSKHLIRSELSRNKAGYKTFLGYSYKDLSFIPYVCNAKNRIYPKVGRIKLSRPDHVQELVEDFITDMDTKRKSAKIKRKERSLNAWLPQRDEVELRDCIKLILSDNFSEAGDGYQRAMFILANELKRVHPDQAAELLRDWNVRMGDPVKDEDIEYRLSQKNYTLTCKYVHEFLSSLGIDNIPINCKHKIYK